MAYICNDLYTTKDIMKMEVDILIAVGYKVNYNPAIEFIRCLAPIYIEDNIPRYISRYLSNLCYLSDISVEYITSKMGTACVFLSYIFLLGDDVLTNKLEKKIEEIYQTIGYVPEDYLIICLRLLDFLSNEKKKGDKVNSIFKDFSSSAFKFATGEFERERTRGYLWTYIHRYPNCSRQSRSRLSACGGFKRLSFPPEAEKTAELN